jgi:hypothetical protein
MSRVRKVPLWVVVCIILIGLLLSRDSYIPLTLSIAVAGVVVAALTRGVDRLFGFILLIAGALLTVQEYRESAGDSASETVTSEPTR